MARRARQREETPRRGARRAREVRAPGKSHVATVIIVLALAGAFFAANYFPTEQRNENGVITVSYGRPKTGWKRTWSEADPSAVTAETIESGRNMDIGIALAVMCVAAAFSEWRLYASASRYRGRESDRDDEDDDEE